MMSLFNAFKSVIGAGVWCVRSDAPQVGDKPRSFFDKLNDWARGEGAPGLWVCRLKALKANTRL